MGHSMIRIKSHIDHLWDSCHLPPLAVPGQVWLTPQEFSSWHTPLAITCWTCSMGVRSFLVTGNCILVMFVAGGSQLQCVHMCTSFVVLKYETLTSMMRKQHNYWHQYDISVLLFSDPSTDNIQWHSS